MGLLLEQNLLSMEIERKFLVDKVLWALQAKPEGQKIKQAYLVNSPEKTIRVRTKGTKGFLTIKGPTVGISRAEYEYEIPIHEAEELIQQFAVQCIEKVRYEITVGKHLWEVDEFYGKHAGLMLAEIELIAENELFEHPEWVTIEVSHDTSYFNSNLIQR
ncbi:MAG: CYTH domain-containing protein [Crocinitomicaceae bacterium]|nr:CYTH domain-containing protein [Crocinitomicaceae bacterium]